MSYFGTSEHICLFWTPYEEERDWEFRQNLGYTWFFWPNPIFISSLKLMISEKVNIDIVHPLAHINHPFNSQSASLGSHHTAADSLPGCLIPHWPHLLTSLMTSGLPLLSSSPSYKSRNPLTSLTQHLFRVQDLASTPRFLVYRSFP